MTSKLSNTKICAILGGQLIICSYGRDQTCAMLLALASGNTFMASDRINFSAYSEVVQLNNDIAAIAKQAFYDLGDRPIWVERGYQGGLFAK